jgi:hypothetical protein
MLYMVTFTINIPLMLAYIPYMDPMGHSTLACILQCFFTVLAKSLRGPGELLLDPFGGNKKGSQLEAHWWCKRKFEFF